MSAPKEVPVMYRRDALPGPTTIPWSVADKAYSIYHARYPGQSLQTIAERGGFGSTELDEFLPGWRDEASEVVSLRAQLADARSSADLLQHLLDQAGAALAEARAAAPRWVPVTERLPEFGETVLVPGGLAFLRASGGWYSLITDRPICWEVRHWMPLTSAPAPEER